MITALKNSRVAAYIAACTHAALFSITTTGTAAGTELTGGTPAYARKPTSWSTPANGATSLTPVTFDVASGSTVAGGGFFNALTGGVYQDGGPLASQPFSSQGTYQLSATFSE